MAGKDDIAWLRQSIGEGLAGLVALHLDGGPSREVIKQTAGIWYVVLLNWPITWDESLDKPRLRIAFRTLAGQAKRWPAPSDLRQLLPARQYPQPALAEPEYPPEKAKENLKRIKAMIQEVLK